jgi:hypothetical protein
MGKFMPSMLVIEMGGRGMSCCCPSCDARMIELVQAIDDLRRSLVIVLQEREVNTHMDPHNDRYYWEHG